ncbi:unnamed protein product [Clavelina lepadiformis]|uniref:Uncharacterized protein n=1 Tax=Clavelina lepadiformis TaxID=159417 RepID=A0ABP0G3E1_CLALP
MSYISNEQETNRDIPPSQQPLTSVPSSRSGLPAPSPSDEAPVPNPAFQSQPQAPQPSAAAVPMESGSSQPNSLPPSAARSNVIGSPSQHNQSDKDMFVQSRTARMIAVTLMKHPIMIVVVS